MIFVGIGALCISWLPDKYGRRKTLIICGMITTPAQVVMLYCPNFYVRFVCYCLLAFFYIHNTMCFNYMFELTEAKYVPSVLSFITVWDTLIVSIVNFSYLTFTNDWQPPFAFFTWFGAICIFLQILIIPDSPKFLLLAGRKQEAVNALNQIAQLNRSNFRFTINHKFIEEEV